MSSKLNYILNLNIGLRILIRFFIETSVFFTIYVIWVLSFDPFDDIYISNGLIHFLNLIAWSALYKFFSLDKDRLRFSSFKSYFPLIKIAVFISALLSLEHFLFSSEIKFSGLLVVFLLLLNSLSFLRVLARQFIRRNAAKNKQNILVYGTSDLAIDLVNAMTFSRKYRVVGFIADTPSKRTYSLAGLPIVGVHSLKNFTDEHSVKLVVIASERASDLDSNQILTQLDSLGLSVSYAPTMDRAFDYEVQLKAVKPEDVLGRRNNFDLDSSLKTEIKGRVIFVTGGGGSIGSELCRQLLSNEPKTLIILDISELALYSLEQELSQVCSAEKLSTEIKYILGSINDTNILSSIFSKYLIQIIYHAAAYKHVPIVENNIIAGINNNVFGTRSVAQFASNHKVEKFVLVSTDKAVRPTSVMGASKRLAELICQTLFDQSKVVFTIVRFGNVLGSSGSVIPKFKSQIKSGGPVTVTHEDVTRYFMSIPEAAHLVINAGNMAKGGEVFLLDMGAPIKIVDLAQTMIRQHGLQPILPSERVKRKKAETEILIDFSGLRLGEKLYEELLIDSVAKPTKNSKIFSATDVLMDKAELIKALDTLEGIVNNRDTKGIIEHLKRLPIDYSGGKSDLKIDTSKSSTDRVTEYFLAEPNENKEQRLVESKKTKNFFMKVLGNSRFTFILHKYFWLIRGMTIGVRVAILNRDKEVLLVRHTYLGGWHLPGGGVDHGETIFEAARREVFEETGIANIQFSDKPIFYLNDYVSKRDHIAFFHATTKESKVQKSTMEIAESRFFRLDQLPTDIEAGAYKRLQEFVNKSEVDENMRRNWQ